MLKTREIGEMVMGYMGTLHFPLNFSVNLKCSKNKIYQKIFLNKLIKKM
jgi:hypothetical protein